MADKSKIEWTEATWNPVTGCSKLSAGCKNCYAERLALRLQAMGNARYRNGFKVALHPDLIELPTRWREPRLIFVNSMSDLFHENVPLDFIQRVFATMRNCPQHTFQVLTKRSARLRTLASQLDWPPNVWMGVSVEDARVLYRIADLRTVPFFFKQWGGVRKDLNGRELGGRTYDEMPRQPVIPTRREQFELVPA